MPTTTSSQGESLLKDLSCETLTTEYNQLKAQYDSLMKRDRQSQLDLEQTQTRLDEARMAATLNQREKELVENKLHGITSTKHESEALINDLRQSMVLLRSENTKLSQDNKEYHIKVIKIQSEKDAEHYENETLKLQVNDLHQRLNNSINNEESARQAQLHAESEAHLQAESQRRNHEQMQAQKSYLAKERDSLSATVLDLRQQATRYKTDMECAVERCNTFENRVKKLEADRIATKKNHQSLIDLYEKQRFEAEGMIANFSSDLQLSQQKAATEHTKLEQENDSLRLQLTEALDRLQVTRNSVDKLIGNEESDSASTSSPSTATCASTNLLKTMKQYENTGKHWDDIYVDFFDLRDSNTRLTAINTELATVNKRLVREQINNQRYQDQLEADLERLRGESSESHATTLESLAALKSSSAKEISELKKKADDLQLKNNDLDATVNDTTYQLRYLLRYVEYQYGSVPPNVQNTNNLLSNAHIPAHLSHEKMIFRDAADLLQRNQDLMTEVRHLTSQLQEKTNEVLAVKNSNSLLNDKVAELNSLTRDYNENIQVLELRLSRGTQAPLQQTSKNDLDSDAPMSNASTPDEKPRSQDSQDLATALETCHEQRQQIVKLNSEAEVVRQNHATLQLELDQLKQHNIGLTNVSSSRATEIDELRSLVGVKESHIGDLEGRLRTLNNEVMTTHRHLETLRNDYTSVSAQLKANAASYEHLLLENKELGNERRNLATLLQNMNDSLGSSASGTVHLVEELKQHNERLTRELQNLRDTLTSKEKEIRNYQAIDHSEWKDKYQITSGELKQLKTTYLELEKQLATANQDRIIAQTKLMEALQNTSSGGMATTGSDTPDQPTLSLSSQAEQLIDANNQVAALKKDIYIFKERLMDSDACTNKITEKYNTFAREAQLQIDKLSDELASSHQTVDTLQGQLEKTAAEHKDTMAAYHSAEQQWDTTKATLVQENHQLQVKLTNVTKQIADLQAELNTTVEHLRQGEERYQAEVAARAQDANVIAGLRDDVQRLNMDISVSRSEVVGANERLQSAEVTYLKQKEHLEAIQNDTKLRLDESQKHQESLSALIQDLLNKVNELRTSPNDIDNAAISTLGENATQQLRDLSASLRREKDIWQTRYTDAQQRADGLASDLEFVQHQLSTTRALLETLRAEKDQTAKRSHQGLKDANNEAALYKKHNASLRSTMDELRGRVVELETLVAAKEELVEPLSLKAKGLELELVQTREHIQTLEVRQAQWSARSARLLSKYDISDPQDLDQLKGEMEVAKAQLDAKTKSLDASEKQYQDLVTKTTQIEEQLKRVTESANQRGKLAFEFKKKVADLEESTKKLEEQLAERHNGQQQAPDPKIKELEDACQKQTEEHTALRTKYTTLLRTAKQLSTERRALEPLRQQKTELTKQLDTVKAEMEQLKAQLTTKSEETSTLQVEIGRLKAMHSMVTNKNDKLKKELATLQGGGGGGSPSGPKMASTLTASAPAFIPAGKDTPTGNHLKRASADDLDSQPPTKK